MAESDNQLKKEQMKNLDHAVQITNLWYKAQKIQRNLGFEKLQVRV